MKDDFGLPGPWSLHVLQDLHGFKLSAGILLAVICLAVTQTATSAGADQRAVSQAEYREVRWSPDGKSLAVVMRTDPKSRFRIAIMPADGGEPRWLTTDVQGVMMPRWSPDGRRIAYVTATDGSNERLDVVDVDGGPVRPIVAGRLLQFDLGYTWTSDGRGLEDFVRFLETDRGHYVVDLEGRKTRTSNTESIGAMFYVEWSPDHSQIAFHDYEPGMFVVGNIRVPATRI
jgi:Tol biopolymer transport system component